MRKYFFDKVLLAVLLAGTLAASANAGMVKVKVTNKTDATVSIAFARTQTDSGGEMSENPDCSKGWWNIQPGQTRTISTYEFSPFHTVFFYAKSKGGKVVWGGKSGGKDRAFWIHTKNAFNVTNSRKIADGKRVYFRYMEASNIPDKVCVLNLTVRK